MPRRSNQFLSSVQFPAIPLRRTFGIQINSYASDSVLLTMNKPLEIVITAYSILQPDIGEKGQYGNFTMPKAVGSRNYTCVANNTYGSAQYEYQVTIKSKGLFNKKLLKLKIFLN